MLRAIREDLQELVSSAAEETSSLSDVAQVLWVELFYEGNTIKDLRESLDYIINDNAAGDNMLSTLPTIEESADTSSTAASSSRVTVTIVQSRELSPVDQELERRIVDPQTYLEPLPDVMKQQQDEAQVNSVVPLQLLLMTNQDVFHDIELTDSLEDTRHTVEQRDLSDFLEAFDICERTEDISELLQTNAALAHIFHQLVPIQVSYTEFWKRYFYRCDRVRVQRELLQECHNNYGSDDDDDEQDSMDDNHKEDALASKKRAEPSSPKSVMKMQYQYTLSSAQHTWMTRVLTQHTSSSTVLVICNSRRAQFW